ncbi:MAG: hypothetical protein JST76_15825 [Bacteroidetes bacterium]|nr:hypothetical protein [Bacteroidota bacterium]
MKTNKDIQDKLLLSLCRERWKLWRRFPEKVALERPIQRGWKRCYFLTNSAQQQSDAPMLEAILKEINVVRYHWKRSFAPTKRWRRRQMEQLDQPLQRIKPWRRRRSNFPQEWKRYFMVEHVFQKRDWEHTWRFRWPQLFELRIVPHMVHELPVCDPEGDSRLSEIEKFLLHPRKAGRLNKLLGARRWKDSDARRKSLERLAQKRIRAAMAGDVEAEETACIRAVFPASAFQACITARLQQGTPTGPACRDLLLTRSCRHRAA